MNKNKKKPTTGRGVTYIVRTFSLSPAHNKVFDEAFDKLDKYAIKHELRRPGKGEVIGRMLEKAGGIEPEDYFK